MSVERLFSGVSLLGLLCISLGGCSKDSGIQGPEGSPSDVVFPERNVSYAQHVQVLFNQTCALVGCHSQAEPPDQLRLDTYENLRFGVRGIPVVIPGDAQNSRLVMKIEGRADGARMPLNRNPLNQNQITGIRTWINEGAQRN